MAVVTYDETAVLCAWFSSVVFLLGYSVIARWWLSPIGQAVAFLDACLVIALFPSVLHQLFGLSVISIFFAWYYGSSLFLVAAITLWRLALIVGVQRSSTPRRHLAHVPEQRGGPEGEIPSTVD